MHRKKAHILEFICPMGFYGAERWILTLARHLSTDLLWCDLAVTLESNSRDIEVIIKYRQIFGDAFEIPMNNRFDPGVIHILVALITERDIDIILTHAYKSDIFGVIIARNTGIKCVVTYHEFENARDPKSKLLIWLGNMAMRLADRVVQLSLQLIDDDRLGLPQSFDLFVMTSTKEGIPRCLIEAWAMGMPVTAYNIPGIDQLITNEKTGQPVTTRDKKTIARYRDKLLFYRQVAMDFAGNNRQYVHTHHSVQLTAGGDLGIFEQLTSD